MNARRSIDKLYYIDEQASGGNTWVHSIHPAAKLAAAVFFIAAVTSRPKYALAEVLALALLPAAITAFSRLPAAFLLSRSLLALPPVALVGVFNLFMDKEAVLLGGLQVPGGAASFAALLVKGYLCLFMMLIFSVSSGIDGLTQALAFFRLPSAFIMPVALVYRYIFLFLGEALLMWQAYSLRGGGKSGGIAFRDWGSFAGGLLLRSLSHSDSLNRAMLMRGWNGRYVPSGAKRRNAARSLCYLAFCIAFILLCII